MSSSSSPISLSHLWKSTIHESWNPLTDILISDYFPKIESELSNYSNILPNPEDIFRVFRTSLYDIKIVLLGQDPYHQVIEGEPVANGLAFCINKPPIPSSLNNILKNLIKYNHITTKDHKILEKSSNHIFLLNTSLTVTKSKPGSHTKIWKDFTKLVISYISSSGPVLTAASPGPVLTAASPASSSATPTSPSPICFMLFGKQSLSFLPQISTPPHHTIISSHPSGLSCYSKMPPYEAFMNQDHFGIAKKCHKDKTLLNCNGYP